MKFFPSQHLLPLSWERAGERVKGLPQPTDRPHRRTRCQNRLRTRSGRTTAQTHPFRLRRNAITSGVHLQRQLHLYLHRPRQLRTFSPSLPQQPRRSTIPRLFPQRPNRHTEGDDRYSWQSGLAWAAF